MMGEGIKYTIEKRGKKLYAQLIFKSVLNLTL